MLWIRQPSTCVPLSSLGVVSHDEIDGENAVVARLARQHPGFIIFRGRVSQLKWLRFVWADLCVILAYKSRSA